MTLLADLEEFVRDHRSHCTLTGNGPTEPAWHGYMVTAACPCGGVWTSEWASEDNRSVALETELRYFESKKQELLQHHEGKYALIIGVELVGIFDHREEAYKVGVERHGNVPMLIKHIGRDEPPESIPAMNLGLIHARL